MAAESSLWAAGCSRFNLPSPWSSGPSGPPAAAARQHAAHPAGDPPQRLQPSMLRTRAAAAGGWDHGRKGMGITQGSDSVQPSHSGLTTPLLPLPGNKTGNWPGHEHARYPTPVFPRPCRHAPACSGKPGGRSRTRQGNGDTCCSPAPAGDRLVVRRRGPASGRAPRPWMPSRSMQPSPKRKPGRGREHRRLRRRSRHRHVVPVTGHCSPAVSERSAPRPTAAHVAWPPSGPWRGPRRRERVGTRSRHPTPPTPPRHSGNRRDAAFGCECRVQTGRDSASAVSTCAE